MNRQDVRTSDSYSGLHEGADKPKSRDLTLSRSLRGSSLTVLIGLLPFVLALGLAGELQMLHERLTPSAPAAEPAPSQAAPLPGAVMAPGVQRVPDARKPEHGLAAVGLERLRCYAGCPAYTFIARADGSFRYVGEYGVERLGEYTGRVDLGRLNQVMRFIAESDFAALEPSYLGAFLDGPTTYTMVERTVERPEGEDADSDANANIKVVENYAGAGPATLWAIEQLIESLLETAVWDEGGSSR